MQTKAQEVRTKLTLSAAAELDHNLFIHVLVQIQNVFLLWPDLLSTCLGSASTGTTTSSSSSASSTTSATTELTSF